MFRLLAQCGLTMLALMACSITALSVILERFLVLRREKILPQKICQVIEGEYPLEELEKCCRHSSSPLANIARGLLKSEDKEEGFLVKMLNSLFRKELNLLERGLQALYIVASIAPLLGLLGTVIGMVEVFNVIAQMGVGQARALSGGISKALITTVVGLIIAIPTLVFHSYFSKRAESLAQELEDFSHVLMNKLLRKDVKGNLSFKI